MGNLRASSVTPACAEPPSTAIAPGTAMQRPAAPISAQPRKSSDLTNLNLVLPPKPIGAMAPVQRQVILSYTGVVKRVTVQSAIVHRTFAAPPPKTCDISKLWRKYL